MQQVTLRQDKAFMTTWVDLNVKKGDKVSLKGEKGLWDVINVYYGQREVNEINRAWRVGGIENNLV